MKKMAFCPAVVVLLCGLAFGQQYKLLYSFCSATNCADGEDSHGKLVFDKAGNITVQPQPGGRTGAGRRLSLVHRAAAGRRVSSTASRSESIRWLV
jgi:hypothetical protein